MADTNKPMPTPTPPDKVKALPADAFFSEKRGGNSSSNGANK
jgi:hypothetical protein